MPEKSGLLGGYSADPRSPRVPGIRLEVRRLPMIRFSSRDLRGATGGRAKPALLMGYSFARIPLSVVVLVERGVSLDVEPRKSSSPALFLLPRDLQQRR